jgi:hypothetical protein
MLAPLQLEGGARHTLFVVSGMRHHCQLVLERLLLPEEDLAFKRSAALLSFKGCAAHGSLGLILQGGDMRLCSCLDRMAHRGVLRVGELLSAHNTELVRVLFARHEFALENRRGLNEQLSVVQVRFKQTVDLRRLFEEPAVHVSGNLTSELKLMLPSFMHAVLHVLVRLAQSVPHILSIEHACISRFHGTMLLHADNT